MKNITIYGSCVSREPFNRMLLAESPLKIQTYIQKNSVVTLFDKKIEITPDEVAENTNFLKRMTLYDFNKSVVQIIKDKPSDYIIVDFCELRFGIIRVNFKGTSTSLTNCDVTRKTLSLLGDKYGQEEIQVVFGEEPYWYDSTTLNKYIDEFAEFIKNIYSPEKIILINAINCFEYLGDDGTLYPYDNLIKLIKENIVITNATERFYEDFDKQIKFIKFPPDVVGNKNHKLGFSALHYEDSCYDYLAEILYGIMMEDKSQNYIDELYDNYNTKLKKKKRALRIRTSIARKKAEP